MKKFKNKILSILLFAFSILVVHDSLIVDANTNYKASFEIIKETTAESTSIIHTQIHSTMDIPRAEVSILQTKYNSERIFNTLASLTFYINSVLERPPTTS
ncbi:MAG: hypothetical protein L3J10_03985 [Sulfurimonas sp.]|nr:hypothetical protein [Sulfurimonas sp.]